MRKKYWISLCLVKVFGADGAFAPMLKSVIEKALQAEMTAHLDNDERSKGNKRNGKGRKKLKSAYGSFDIETPEDRQSNFEPEPVKKRQTILTDTLSERLLAFTGLE